MHYVGYSSVFIGDGELMFLLFDHRTYCNTEEQHEHRHLTQIQAIKLFMTGRRPHLKCKAQLRDALLFEMNPKQNDVWL